MPVYPALGVKDANIRSAMSQGLRDRLSQRQDVRVERRLGFEERESEREQTTAGKEAFYGAAANSLMTVLSANDVQKPDLWKSEVSRLRANPDFAEFMRDVPDDYNAQTAEAMLSGVVDFGRRMKVEKAMREREGAPPSGFGRAGNDLAPISGGPADPAYKREIASATQQPLTIERKLHLAGIDPKSEQGQKLIMADLAGQQIELEQTDEGLRLSIGKGVNMEKKTLGDIEKKLLGARENLARLRNVAMKFRPEFQEIPTRLGVAWTGLKARIGLGNISSEDQKLLSETADFFRDSISVINLYIKDITGAQMSASETDRLRLAVPDPGEGIFSGDDPITFKAKLDSAIQDIERAIVRYEYYLSQGITDPEEMARRTPLDRMPTAINEQTGERIVEIDGQWVPLK